MPDNLTISKSFSVAKDITLKYYGLILAVLITSGIINSVVSRISSTVYKNAPILGLILFVIYIAVIIFFEANTLSIFLNLVDDKKAEFKELFTTKQDYATYFLASLAMTILVIVGLILFIVPGIILSLVYSQVPYLIVDKKLSLGDAFKKSAEMTKGYRGTLFLQAIALAGINILGLIPLGLGLLFTIPFTNVTRAVTYKMLRDERFEATIDSKTEVTKEENQSPVSKA